MDFLTLFLCIGVFLLGVIVGSVATLALIYPLIGRAIGRVVGRVIAVLALAISAALIVWPMVCMIRGETMRPVLLPMRMSIEAPGDAFGFSAAMLVLGGMTLWFSSRSGEKKANREPLTSPAAEMPPPEVRNQTV
jgi:hypothetical protein